MFFIYPFELCVIIKVFPISVKTGYLTDDINNIDKSNAGSWNKLSHENKFINAA